VRKAVAICTVNSKYPRPNPHITDPFLAYAWGIRTTDPCYARISQYKYTLSLEAIKMT